MPLPIRTQVFDSMLGTQENIHSIILPDVFSSGGSQNLFIDQFARAKRIDGYDNRNVAAVTTNTGDSTGIFRTLFAFRSLSGGSVTRQLLGVLDDGSDEQELWSSTDEGVNWTFRTDFGASSVGTIPILSQFGDEVFIVNGVISPRKWNGSSLTTAGGTQSPTITAAVTASATGFLVGTKQWKLVSVETDGTRHPGSVASTAVQFTSEQASLTWTADADTDVVGYELYATTGTGKIFYFEDYIDGRTTAAYTSNLVDTELLESRVLEEHGDAPPTGAYFAASHKNRMWYLRTNTYPRRGWFSDPGNAESVYAANNYVDFSDIENLGDRITGAVGNYEGRMIVGLERSIWTISGTGQIIGNLVDFTRTRANPNIGWVSQRSVLRIPAGAKYIDQNGKSQTTEVVTLAYWTPIGDIRLFDGDNDVVISFPVNKTVKAFNYAQRQKVWALQDTGRDHATWFFPSSSATEPDMAVTWNWRWGVWYIWTPQPFAHGVEVESASEASVLLVAESAIGTGAFVYKLWDTNTFNGTNIVSQWMTKTLFGQDDNKIVALGYLKRWRFLDALLTSTQGAEPEIEWVDGLGEDDAAGFSLGTLDTTGDAIETADGDAIQTADGDALILSTSSVHLKKLVKNADGRHVHSEGIRFRIKDSSSSEAWAIEAFSVGYQLLPGLKRRIVS